MKVSPVHRDSVANICLRIQRERAARGGAIRIDGRKVVPTKGGRDPIEIRGGLTWRAIIINEGAADIYTYISRTPAGILTTVSPLIKFDRFATESVSFVAVSGLTSRRKISRS